MPKLLITVLFSIGLNAFWAFNTDLLAQTNLSLEASTTMSEVAAGNQFEITYTLKGDNNGRLQAPSFAPFQSTGSNQRVTGATIINGQMTGHTSWVFTLIAPERTGTFTIPAATATAKGKTILSQPLKIKVVANSYTAPKPGKVTVPNGANENIFVTTTLSKNNTYIGQQVICQVRIYTRLTIDNFDVLELPAIENCFVQELKRYNSRTEFVKIKGLEYATRALYTAAVFPQKEGTIKIKPARVRVGVEQSGSIFGVEPMMLNTPVTTLKVKPFPQPIPSDFCGVSGSYDIELQADRDSLTMDDALTLRIAVRGNGDARRFEMPKLTPPDGLEVFDPKVAAELDYENGQEMMHSRTYEYVILPKKTGIFEYVPTLSWFNPDSNRYVTWKADTMLSIKVLPGKNNAAIQEADKKELDRGESNWWPPSSKVLGGGALALAALITGLYFFLSRKKKQSTITDAATMQQIPVANKQAEKEVAPVRQPVASKPVLAEQVQIPLTEEVIPTRHLRVMLQNETDPKTFYAAAYRALETYFTKQIGIPDGGISDATIQQSLTARGWSADRIQNLRMAWETCELALYAGQAHADKMEETLDRIALPL